MYLYDKRCNWVKCHVTLSGDGVRADGGPAPCPMRPGPC